MNYFKSTIGRKQMVGVAGLLLCGFLLAHMSANMLIIFDSRMYNEYSHALVSNPLIYAAEAALALFFLSHIFMALKSQIRNWAARDVRYAVKSNGPKGTSLVAKAMWAQGVIIFVFLILHLVTFKFGTYYSINYGEGEIRDLHRLVVEVFQIPAYVIWYLVSLVILSLHLGYGFSSSFQTLGLNHPKYTPLIEKGGLAFSFIVSLGFLSLPTYVYFFLKG